MMQKVSQSTGIKGLLRQLANIAMCVCVMASHGVVFAEEVDDVNQGVVVLSTKWIATEVVPVQGVWNHHVDGEEVAASVSLEVSSYRVEFQPRNQQAFGDHIRTRLIVCARLRSHEVLLEREYYMWGLPSAPGGSPSPSIHFITDNIGNSYLWAVAGFSIWMLEINDMGKDKVVGFIQYLQQGAAGVNATGTITLSADYARDGNWGVNAIQASASVRSIEVVNGHERRVEVVDEDGDVHRFLGSKYHWRCEQ